MPHSREGRTSSGGVADLGEGSHTAAPLPWAPCGAALPSLTRCAHEGGVHGSCLGLERIAAVRLAKEQHCRIQTKVCFTPLPTHTYFLLHRCASIYLLFFLSKTEPEKRPLSTSKASRCKIITTKSGGKWGSIISYIAHFKVPGAFVRAAFTLPQQ